MLFGGTKTPETFQGTPEAANNTVSVGGMATVDALLFTLFRLTLVDDYDYDVSVCVSVGIGVGIGVGMDVWLWVCWCGSWAGVWVCKCVGYA